MALLENIDSETATARGDGQVHFQFPIELFALLVVHQLIGDGCNHTRLERFFGHGFQTSLKFGTRRRSGTQIQIRTVVGRQQVEPFFYDHATSLYSVFDNTGLYSQVVTGMTNRVRKTGNGSQNQKDWLNGQQSNCHLQPYG